MQKVVNLRCPKCRSRVAGNICFECYSVITPIESEDVMMSADEFVDVVINNASQQGFAPDPETGWAKSDDESTPDVSGR